MSESSAGRGASLRSRFSAAGRLLGARILIDDGEDWRVEDGTIQVGLGFFSARGHSDDEAEALALLELWGAVRDARIDPIRVRRRRSLATLHPELEPLLAALDRMQATSGVLMALPAVRASLAAAVRRTVPDDIRAWPRHLQWVSFLLTLQLAPERRPRIGAEVQAAVEAAFGSADVAQAGELLRMAVAPATGRTSLQRLERGLALTLGPYRRLLELDREDVGLAAAGGQADPADDDAAEALPPDAGAGTGEADAAEEELDAAADDEASEAGAWDLFAAAQSGFLDRVLATPLPAQGPLVSAVLEEAARVERETGEAERVAGGAGRDAVALAEYRHRSDDRSAAIDRMRAVWQEVIADRTAPRRASTRTPHAEGEELHADALASALAEIHAGAPRPEVFRRRIRQPRRAEQPGSTDYVLAIDRSGSMWGRPSEAAADAALIMLEGLAGAQRDIAHAERVSGGTLELGIRTALIAFDATPVLVKPLAGALTDESRLALHSEIRSPAGGTNDAAALALAGRELGVTGDDDRGGSRPGAGADGLARRRIVILVSDGDSNDPGAADERLRVLRAAGVEVFGIGIGSEELVRRYAPTSIGIGDPEQIPAAVQELVDRSVRPLRST